MGTPRVKGTALRVVRHLSDVPFIARRLAATAMKDYGVVAMLGLPAEARRAFDVEPRPIAGAPPRAWEDAGLGPPPPAGHRVGAARLRAAYAAGSSSPEVVLATIERTVAARAFGKATHAPFVALDFARAQEAAAASAARWRAGTPRGPLDGIPVPVKDQHDMTGLPTRGGTAYRTEPAARDAFMVKLLREAGALLYAKTHTTEWGMTPTGINPHFAMPRNVYDARRAPGGSSTGSAVACALGLATVASGSDGGGSIRVPGALEGVFGLKPGFLRIGRTGDAFGGSVGHTGPLGQSVADLVDFLEITSISDLEDPVTTYPPDAGVVFATRMRSALGRGVKGCRIGVPAREWRDADAPVAACGQAALAALERDGARLVDVTIRGGEHAPAVGILTIAGEALGNLSDDMARHGAAFSDDLWVNLNILRTIGAREFFAAARTRAALRRDVAATLAGVDVLALPATATVAPHHPLDEHGVHVADAGAVRALVRFAFLGNLTGLPAGSAPAGMVDGLPVGLQILGDAWDEPSVLAVMAHVERLGLATLPRPEGYVALV